MNDSRSIMFRLLVGGGIFTLVVSVALLASFGLDKVGREYYGYYGTPVAFTGKAMNGKKVGKLVAQHVGKPAQRVAD